MIKIETKITLNANAQKIWDKLIDFNNYPQWNPFIVRISGNQTVGARLSVDIRPPASKKMTFTPKLITFDEAKEMRWVGTFGGKLLFCGEHYFTLERIDDNTTHFIQGEIFSGLLAKITLAKIKTNVENGFNMMNHALKDLILKEGSK